jgi:hypothetical protein
MAVTIEFLIRRAGTAAAALAARHPPADRAAFTGLAFLPSASPDAPPRDGHLALAPDDRLAAASALAWERHPDGHRVGEADRPAALASVPQPADTGAELMSLGSAWHALHYLLTGGSGLGDGRPEASLLGGTLLEDHFGSPAGRWLSPEQTRAFAAALENFAPATIEQRIDPVRMQMLEILGCETVTPACRERIRASVESYLPALRDFLREAAARNQGLLMWFA